MEKHEKEAIMVEIMTEMEKELDELVVEYGNKKCTLWEIEEAVQEFKNKAGQRLTERLVAVKKTLNTK